MDFVSAALSPSVVCSACLTLAATTAWRWVIDWRQARTLGVSVADFRLGNIRRLFVVGQVRKRQRRQVVESSARVTVPVLVDSVAHSTESAVEALPSPRHEPALPLSETHEKADKIKAPAESSTAKPRCPARVIVSNADQMRDFLAYELARKTAPRIKREFREWFDAYLRWAEIHSISTMPENKFLQALGKSAGVEKKIERLKDPRTGRVVKNDAGSPIRVFNYVLGDDELASPKRPRETRQQKMAREMAEIAARRQQAAAMPDRTWAEELAALPQSERFASGLEIPRRAVA
jgi:hypothetical protein